MIYIEPETLKRANENLNQAIENSKHAIESDNTDDIKVSVDEVIQRSQDLRAFICANYNLRMR